MPTWVAILISASVVAGVAVGRWLWKLAEWKGGVNTDQDNFKAFMKEIRSKLDQIFIRLPPPGLSTNESPVVLNELGKKVSGAMGIKVWAEKTAPTFLEKVEGWKEHLVYDFCTDHAETLDLTEEQQDVAKALAYEHGFRPEQVRTAYAIELRDALLALQGAESGE